MNEKWEKFETLCKLSGYNTNTKSKAYNTLHILNFYLVEILKCERKCYYNNHRHGLDYISNQNFILTITHERSKYNKNMIVRFIDKYNHMIPSKIHVLKYFKENGLL